MSVVIVGAGVVGASVVYHLARQGADVTLVDRGPGPAAGVTGVSFAWIGGFGGDWPGRAHDLRGSVLADYRRLEAELPDVAVRWTGSLRWPDSSVGEGQYEVGRDEIRSLEPGLRTPPERAVYTPSDGGVDPVAVTGALVRGARALGARVVFGAGDTSLKVVGGRVAGVTSAAGFHPASTVVLAAGTGVASLIEPLGIDLPVTVSPARLVRLTAPPGLVRGIVAGPDFEVRELREGQLLMTVPRTAELGVRALRSAVHGAERCRVLDSRVGLRPMPPDGPLIGHVTSDRSLYVAVMHSAVTLAPTIGRLVADELAPGPPPPR
ncbi:FAD-binding oxidoreductase [Streptomyces sp. GESEQ-35]|uniref:NAD(P)/FAD-dependent oxidoreductase n=1 Tax=Streptomyces sp. GESEQ-35 TaxID=2812657 RepID=UPI001B33242E|nr:FAD-dependent oxidoreductase [Streptomyces sp. GESEQ-35]